MISQRKHILKAQLRTAVRRSTANPESDRAKPRKTNVFSWGHTVGANPASFSQSVRSKAGAPKWNGELCCREPAALAQHCCRVPSPLWVKALRFSLGKSLILPPHSGHKHLCTATGTSKLPHVGTLWNILPNFVRLHSHWTRQLIPLARDKWRSFRADAQMLSVAVHTVSDGDIAPL